MEVAGEVNLAIFYLRGLYYDLAKRTLGVDYVGLSSTHVLRIAEYPLVFINGRRSQHTPSFVLTPWDPTGNTIAVSPCRICADEDSVVFDVYGQGEAAGRKCLGNIH